MTARDLFRYANKSVVLYIPHSIQETGFTTRLFYKGFVIEIASSQINEVTLSLLGDDGFTQFFYMPINQQIEIFEEINL